MGNISRKVFVVINPSAGKEGQVDGVREELARYFIAPRWTLEIHETAADEDMAAVCRAACERGASLVIAAGGDGTLVGVANGLVNGPVPLGIIPLGTGNDLARALTIPLKLDKAVELLAGSHVVMEVDALRVGGRHYFSNVSVGFSPEMMSGTTSGNKKRFGRLAYVLTMVRRASIFRQQRYLLTLDGRARSIRAVEVMISNTTLLENPPYVFGPPETLSDGQLEVYVVTARTLGDYMRLAWDLFARSGKPAAKLLHWTAGQSACIDTTRRARLVQADGEVIGRTPVIIQMVPKAIRVIIPIPGLV